MRWIVSWTGTSSVVSFTRRQVAVVMVTMAMADDWCIAVVAATSHCVALSMMAAHTTMFFTICMMFMFSAFVNVDATPATTTSHLVADLSYGRSADSVRMPASYQARRPRRPRRCAGLLLRVCLIADLWARLG